MASVHAGIVHQPHGKTVIEHLPLEQVSVKAWVVDVSSRIVLIQTFYNPSDEPTGRAKYVFPLPASAAVCAFKLKLEDGQVIVGEVKEKDEAALTFTRAVEQGKTAALVERVTDDIFTISVGSIPATTRVTACLTFVMDLLDEAVRDHVRLQLPMYVAGRYGTPPAAMHNTSTADSRTRLRISVDIQTSEVIYDIHSPTHDIALRHYKGGSDRESQRRMSVVWESPEFLTSDFVITIHAEGLDKPRCFAEVLDARRRGDGEDSTIAMQLTLVPKFQAPKVPSQEYIFIIDRSGSMDGDPIETAKRTLIILLRLLPSSRTTFNIFSFGSEVTSLWRGSRGLNQAFLVEATSHVGSMSADYGGTEIPKALQSAFNSRGLDRPAVVFLLTDGQIYESENLDPRVVVSNAVRNSPPQASTRLFVLGIGPHVSSDVCSSLAQEGNGEYLFALSAENISGKCARLLNAGRSKNIERIDIDWGYDASSPQARFSSPTTPILPAGILALAPPPRIQQAPHSLTKIFSGIRFTVFAITSFRTVPTSVKLITKLEGVSEPHELTVDVTQVEPFRDTDEHSIVPIVHTLAARKLIMELDDVVGPLPTPAPGNALLVSKDDLRRAGIIRLGLTYQLVSKHTSFVAVQKGDGRIRNRGRGSGRVRSKLRRTNRNTHENSSAKASTFLNSLINAVSSFVASAFGFHGGPVTSTSTTNTPSRSRSQHQPRFPGVDSSCWTSLRPSSSLPQFRNPFKRAPLPELPRDTSAQVLETTNAPPGANNGTGLSLRPPSSLPQFRNPFKRAPLPKLPRDTSAQVLETTNPPPGANNGTGLHLGGPSTPAPTSQGVYDVYPRDPTKCAPSPEFPQDTSTQVLETMNAPPGASECAPLPEFPQDTGTQVLETINAPPSECAPPLEFLRDTTTQVLEITNAPPGANDGTALPAPTSPEVYDVLRDPIERAPSPEFLRDTSAQVLGATDARPGVNDGTELYLGGSSRPVPISQEVYGLFLQMDVDGSFTASPLLTRLVGNAVLGKADEFTVDRKVWTTVVVIAYMKIHLQGEPDLLELVSEKAREFVEASDGPERDNARRFDAMIRRAIELLALE